MLSVLFHRLRSGTSLTDASNLLIYTLRKRERVNMSFSGRPMSEWTLGECMCVCAFKFGRVGGAMAVAKDDR